MLLHLTMIVFLQLKEFLKASRTALKLFTQMMMKKQKIFLLRMDNFR